MAARPNSSRHLVLTALFIAIILLQSVVPWLGTLPLGAFANWGSGNDYYVYCRNWGNGLGTARRCVTRFRLGRLFTVARLDISTKHWGFDLP